ncbi:hypothetical protein [Methanococcoides burtonii]|uniref:hypothetical protein n=1 Tax=Methanococcoides burtonii TaxID=29291 RepID=UPI0018DDCB24|nr:hypothetical protein [Methanococcoides burtonii]
MKISISVSNSEGKSNSHSFSMIVGKNVNVRANRASTRLSQSFLTTAITPAAASSALKVMEKYNLILSALSIVPLPCSRQFKSILISDRDGAHPLNPHLIPHSNTTTSFGSAYPTMVSL